MESEDFLQDQGTKLNDNFFKEIKDMLLYKDNNLDLKINKSVAYNSQGSQTGQLDVCK